MRIFFCETFDDGTVGGSHACMYNLIRYMDRSRYDFTAGFMGPNMYVQKYRDIGVDVEVLPFHKPVRGLNPFVRKAVNWYKLEYRAASHLEALFREKGFDLVALNNSICVSHVFVKACNRMKIPVVVYERGIGRYGKEHLRDASRVQAAIPISATVEKVMAEHGYPGSVRRIYDGINPSDLAPARSPADVRKELGIPDGARVIGIIGNVRFWKGQDCFIDAFIDLKERHRDLYGLIIGGWSSADMKFLSGLEKKVRDAGLGGRVIFTGYRKDVPDLLHAIDIFVHASTRPEPFGMVLLEAMAAKKPVIATNIGGPVEILDNGECGALVLPQSGASIAAACEEYIRRPDFARETAERAYQRLSTMFRIDRTVEETGRLFEEVCRRAGEARTENGQ